MAAPTRRLSVRDLDLAGKLLLVSEAALQRGPMPNYEGLVFDGVLPTAETVVAASSTDHVVTIAALNAIVATRPQDHVVPVSRLVAPSDEHRDRTPATRRCPRSVSDADE